MNLNKINLEEILKNKKITLIKFSDFGFPLVLNLKLTDIRLNDYAQHKDCLEIVGRLPRKRKDRLYRIKPYDRFFIYKGTYTENDFDTYIETIKTKDVTITKLGTCFDPNSLNKFLNTNFDLLVNYKDLE